MNERVEAVVLAYEDAVIQAIVDRKAECIRTDNGPEFISEKLDAYLFRNLEEVRLISEKWRNDYNNNRAHEALENMTPIEYKQHILKNSLNLT